METLNFLLQGFDVALRPTNLLMALFGAFVGTVVGMLPGLGPINGVALLLPLAFALGQGSAMQQPLAVAIIAGLAVQLPLVLLVMPVLFVVLRGSLVQDNSPPTTKDLADAHPAG